MVRGMEWMIWFLRMMAIWLDEYREGKGTKELVMTVKQGSSKQYTSHQRVLKSTHAMNYMLWDLYLLHLEIIDTDRLSRFNS